MPFCGKPLLAWSIWQALEAKKIDSVYVTSDDDNILAVSEQCGAHTIKRPDDISGDTATSESALLHVLDEISNEKQEAPKLVVFLQATSPLRTGLDLDNAISLFNEEKVDSLFSATILDDFCIWKSEANVFRSITYNSNDRRRRQDREPLYLENGSFYIFKPEIIKKHNNRLGGNISIYPMPYWKAYEIDSLEQHEICEYYFRKNLLSSYLHTIGLGHIKLVIYDFDGVMTNNKALLNENGKESVTVNRADGLGIKIIKALGVHQIIISTETNKVVQARAEKLGLDVYSGCDDKDNIVQEILSEKRLEKENVVYIGNDINDKSAMMLAGIKIAPSDAHPEIKELADIVLKTKGGDGVVRELADVMSLST